MQKNNFTFQAYGVRPKFFDSKYFVNPFRNLYLNEGAPKELIALYNKYKVELAKDPHSYETFEIKDKLQYSEYIREGTLRWQILPGAPKELIEEYKEFMEDDDGMIGEDPLSFT